MNPSRPHTGRYETIADNDQDFNELHTVLTSDQLESSQAGSSSSALLHKRTPQYATDDDSFDEDYYDDDDDDFSHGSQSDINEKEYQPGSGLANALFPDQPKVTSTRCRPSHALQKGKTRFDTAAASTVPTHLSTCIISHASSPYAIASFSQSLASSPCYGLPLPCISEWVD
jgi:hypothetical protein